MAQFSRVGSSRGAPMGRPDSYYPPHARVRLFKVKLDSGGYDDGGAYWGHSDRLSLYCADDGQGFRMFTRHPTRNDAKEYVLALHPSATFYR